MRMNRKRFRTGLSAAAVSAAALLAASTSAFAGDINLRGDVTDDGTINALDASIILMDYAFRSSGKAPFLNTSQMISADVNIDGSVDAIDASLVLGFYAYTSTVEQMTPEDYYSQRPTLPTTLPPPTAEPVSENEHKMEVINGITYIDGVLIANKTYSLPADFNPGMDETALAWFNVLKNDAAAQGLNIWLASGFRPYSLQYQIYNNNCYWYGQERTDTFSARPGNSEHQTGLAIDVNTINDAFASTPEAAWLAENCWKYGFIIRYPLGKEHITGYKYEPWHIRFVGTEMAEKLYNSGLTVEEYFGIDSQYR